MIAELAYADVIKDLPEHPMFEDIDDRLLYYPIVTREPFRNRGRITELLRAENFYADLGIPSLDAQQDRVLLCGNEGLITDVRSILESTRLCRSVACEIGAIRGREGVRVAIVAAAIR